MFILKIQYTIFHIYCTQISTISFFQRHPDNSNGELLSQDNKDNIHFLCAAPARVEDSINYQTRNGLGFALYIGKQFNWKRWVMYGNK